MTRLRLSHPRSGRGPTRVLLVSLVVASALLAACSRVNLNAPPIEDWSNARGGAPTARPTASDYYTAQRNETLASIAARFGVTSATLAAWNSLPANTTVTPNQVLRVTPPPSMTPDNGGAIVSPINSDVVEQRPNVPTTTGPATPSTSSSNAPLKTGPIGVKKPYSDAALAELSRPDPDAAPASPSPNTTAPAADAVTWAWPTAGRPGTAFGDGRTKGIDIPGKAGDPVLAAADGKVTFASAGVKGYGNFVIVRHSPLLLSVYANNRTNLVKEGATVTRGQKIAEMGDSDSPSVKLHFEIRADSKPVDPLKYLPPR